MFIRSAYNYDRREASKAVAVVCDPEECRTQQQFAEEADINTIVRRFGLTGKVPSTLAMPQVGDFTQFEDFHGAMNAIRAAEEEFLKVPGELRARFNHDPQELMKWLGDPANRAEGEKLGFFKVADVPRAEAKPSS